MSAIDCDRAQQLLSEFIGGEVSSVECDEFQLRLIFQGNSEFVTQSPWRVVLRGNLIMGSGDIKGSAEEIFAHLKGRRVNSVFISNCGDTRLLFEHNHFLEAIANSARYETWEAHLPAGWVVFAGGGITLFPSASTPPNAAGRNL